MPIKEIVYDDAYLEELAALDVPDETAEFDPDAEYNRPAPPIPDGWYQAKLSNSGVYVDGVIRPFRSAQWKNETKPHYEVAVKAELISDDPIINGKNAYTGMPLTTTADPDRNFASGIGAAYKAITGNGIPGMPSLKHAELLSTELLSEPIVYVRVQNVLRDQEVEKEVGQMGSSVITDKDGNEVKITKRPGTVYGQKKIMALPSGTDAKGKFTGVAVHPETGNRVVSRAQIAEIKPSTFTPPASK